MPIRPSLSSTGGASGTPREQPSDSFLVGAAKEEITPPLSVGLLMSSVDRRWQPFETVRLPLYARVLIVEGTARAAIVSLDLLFLSDAAVRGFARFKAAICQVAGNVVRPDEVILACTHTHSAPESGSLSDLQQTADFAGWIDYLAVQIGRAIAAAFSKRQPCSLRLGTAKAPGLGIYRRWQTTSGIEMSHPEPAAESIISREGPVDDAVLVATFVDPQEQVVAMAVNATCHPVYEMCMPHVSPDYPGELTLLLEKKFPSATALFLNGAAGDINPTTVSSGPLAAQQHAARLAAAVHNAIDQSSRSASTIVSIRRDRLILPTRLPDGRDVGVTAEADVALLQIGDGAIAFLPGEPFVETGLAIRQQSPFAFQAVVGYSEATIGYIPTDEAFALGGYETGFGGWSYLSPGCELALRQCAFKLTQKLSPPRH
ncbi:MAG: hypothetical protein SGJ20_08360 [Planctomycetota bacterium]|nr:hypothetical protein [Planctomycetota bacterium]